MIPNKYFNIGKETLGEKRRRNKPKNIYTVCHACVGRGIPTWRSSCSSLICLLLYRCFSSAARSCSSSLLFSSCSGPGTHPNLSGLHHLTGSTTPHWLYTTPHWLYTKPHWLYNTTSLALHRLTGSTPHLTGSTPHLTGTTLGLWLRTLLFKYNLNIKK